MGKRLLSVGLDVGTSTTSLIFSQLKVENRASGFAVPRLEIAEREILYRSPVHFTPLLGENLVDGDGVRAIVEREYQRAGFEKHQVDTGAIIITGETSRKENAAAVLASLSAFAGEFVVATAGPDLESVLAAKGAGAVAYSEETGKTVVHVDIGGGTSNLALIEKGQIVATACLNVGGRLLKLESGRVVYCSAVLQDLTDIRAGESLTRERAGELTKMLTHALEMAVGLREKTELLDKLTTVGTKPLPYAEGAVLSFSGGVAACMEKKVDWDAYGDIGPLLAEAILQSCLCKGPYQLGAETVRATVIGAGCHSTQLSGSTVYCRGVALPLKNLPVAVFTKEEQTLSDFPRLIAQRLGEKDADTVILAMPGFSAPTYGQITALADAIMAGTKGKNIFVCLQSDMAKALGQAIALRTDKSRPCLCIDSVALTPESYLDIGAPVGPCLPVVIKTLVLENRRSK